MVSVIVCTYNRSASLKRTLESLPEMSLPAGFPWEIVVVDNNSTDNTRDIAQEFSRKSGLEVRYTFEGHQGLSHARNRGVREAQGDVIAFTDDDVTVDKNWLFHIQRAFDQFDCVGLGGKITLVWPGERPSWVAQARPGSLEHVLAGLDLGEEPCEMREPPFGANMAFRRVAFEKHGFFRTDLGPCGGALGGGGEDQEFGERLLRAGHKVIYAPDVLVYHHVDKRRTQKAYFLSWSFSEGRYLIRASGFPSGTLLYFGVPRYMFRSLAENLFQWIFEVNPQQRFLRKLKVYCTTGEIVEAHGLSRVSRS